MSFSGTGAEQYGVAGASAGAAFGPYGALIGGAVGALAGGFMGGSSAPVYDPGSVELANLSYENWQQAANLIYPSEQQLLQYAQDPNYINNMRSQAGTDFSNQFAQTQNARSRFFASQGINLNPQQQAAVNKSDALASAQGKAGAMNAATGMAGQLQQAALRGA